MTIVLILVSIASSLLVLYSNAYNFNPYPLQTILLYLSCAVALILWYFLWKEQFKRPEFSFLLTLAPPVLMIASLAIGKFIPETLDQLRLKAKIEEAKQLLEKGDDSLACELFVWDPSTSSEVLAKCQNYVNKFPVEVRWEKVKLFVDFKHQRWARDFPAADQPWVAVQFFKLFIQQDSLNSKDLWLMEQLLQLMRRNPWTKESRKVFTAEVSEEIRQFIMAKTDFTKKDENNHFLPKYVLERLDDIAKESN